MNMTDNISFGYAEVILPKEPYEVLTRVGKMAYEFRVQRDIQKFFESSFVIFWGFFAYFKILRFHEFFVQNCKILVKKILKTFRKTFRKTFQENVSEFFGNLCHFLTLLLTEYPAFTIETLLSQIGGTFGLFLGVR